MSGFVCLMYIDGEIRLLKQRVKKIRNVARRKEWTRLGLSWGIILFFLGYLFVGDMTWHELRDEVGFPYTMEERIKDSYYYEPQGTKDGLMVYTSKQDPNATAIDLIDAIYGKVYTIKQEHAHLEGV